jgi:hypothetical protein
LWARNENIYRRAAEKGASIILIKKKKTFDSWGASTILYNLRAEHKKDSIIKYIKRVLGTTIIYTPRDSEWKA